MAKLHEIAPRLAKAWDQEREYQRRVAEGRKRGQMPFDVAMEELVRNVRRANRNMAYTMESVSAAIAGVAAASALRKSEVLERIRQAQQWYSGGD